MRAAEGAAAASNDDYVDDPMENEWADGGKPAVARPGGAAAAGAAGAAPGGAAGGSAAGSTESAGVAKGAAMTADDAERAVLLQRYAVKFPNSAPTLLDGAPLSDLRAMFAAMGEALVEDQGAGARRGKQREGRR